MFGQDFRKKCTREMDGVLLNKIDHEGVCYITVGYTVDGIGYVCKEPLIGADRRSGISARRPWAEVPNEFTSLVDAPMGMEIRIKYNPKKPKQSYLPDNI